MKIIYQEPIEIRLQKAIAEAEKGNRQIDRIELTLREANQFSDLVRRSLYVQEGQEYRFYFADDVGKVIGKFMGVDLVVGPSA